MTVSRRERDIQEDSLRVAAKLNRREGKHMCISKSELESKVQEIGKFRTME